MLGKVQITAYQYDWGDIYDILRDNIISTLHFSTICFLLSALDLKRS